MMYGSNCGWQKRLWLKINEVRGGEANREEKREEM